jgi:hypothetical protein
MIITSNNIIILSFSYLNYYLNMKSHEKKESETFKYVSQIKTSLKFSKYDTFLEKLKYEFNF